MGCCRHRVRYLGQSLELAKPTVRQAWSLLVIALWNTTLTQYLWIGGLAHAPDITRASYLFFLKPAIATVLAVAILSQPLTLIQVIAIIAICGSVLIEFMYQAKQKAKNNEPVAPRRIKA